MSFNEELSLVSKLKSLGMKFSPFEGVTTFESRRELVRAAVKILPDVVYTVRDGKNVTLSQQFEKVYACKF